MATENLKVKITADANQAKAEIGKFKDSLKGTVKSGDSAVKMLKKVTAASAVLAATIKVTTKAIKNAINVAAMGDDIKDQAQKVFMGTTAYQEWGYVLKQNGIEIGALKMGMRKFAQEVANGSDALKKYGITATDVDTAFAQAIATIQNMPSETEKIAAATELFGSRALELFPILNLTNAKTQNLMATYRAIGATMSNELIAASDTCTDSITEMKMAWQGLKNLLGAYVIPVVTKVVQWITMAIAKIRILLAAILGVKETFGGKTGKKDSLAGSSGSVAVNTGKTANNLKKAARQAKELRRTLMGIDELTKLVEQATASAASGGGGGGGASSPAVSIDTSGIEDMEGLFSSDMLDNIEKFRAKIESVKDLLNGAYLILKGLVEISLGNFVQGWADISEGVKKCWENLKELCPWLQKVEDGWNAIKRAFDNFFDAVQKGWKNIKDWFAENIAPKFDLKIPTWEDVKAKWDKLIANFKGASPKIGVTIPKFTSAMKKKWNALKKKFTGKNVNIGLTFSAAVGDLKKWVNNNVIAKINAKFKQVPILKNHLIPKLASGGVLTAPTPALLGEYAGARQNPEIATPQSLMAETIRDANGDLVGAFAQMTRQVIAAINDKDLSVKIGDETIARSAQRGNTAYYNRTGKALLTI